VGEVAPEGYSAEELAPLLDSEKDQAAGAFADEEVTEAPVAEEAPVEGEAPVEEAPVEEEAVATPTSDEEAQPALTQEVVSITVEEGERVDAETVALSERRSTERVGRDWERRERPQNVNIVNQIGLSVVFQTGNTYYIETPDTPRLWYEDDRDYYVENLSNGRTREVVVRSDGTQIVTIRDRFGDIVRRSRIEPDGREFLLVYVDDSYQRYDDQGRWIDPGRELPPLRLNIPAREYVLDASFAQEDELEQFLYQPPVERLTRYYTVEEVKRSSRVRDMVRRLEIGDLTFETASANIPQDQVRSLSAVANAMLDMLENNPGETFLIEGHTDAVGDDLYNLELSDQRAQSVAYALTRVYGVPAENLATQGYGERYLKINTQQAERLNRRVTIRRITPLVTPLTPTASN
jgi:outer membrane protein OmpA-like peptidoglycan-associated protein